MNWWDGRQQRWTALGMAPPPCESLRTSLWKEKNRGPRRGSGPGEIEPSWCALWLLHSRGCRRRALRIVLAGAAGDADRADDLPINHQGHTAFNRHGPFET